MLYTGIILRLDTMDRVLAVAGGDIELFKSMIAQLVADGFNDVIPGNVGAAESSAYDCCITTNCPDDISLQIAAWWSKIRGPKFGLIQRRIRQRLKDLCGDEFKIEVFMNIHGRPKVKRKPEQLQRLTIQINDLLRVLTHSEGCVDVPVHVSFRGLSKYRGSRLLIQLGLVETIRRGGGNVPTVYRVFRCSITTEELRQLLEDA